MQYNNAISECNAINAININIQLFSSMQPARLIIKPSFHIPHECNAMRCNDCDAMNMMQCNGYNVMDAMQWMQCNVRNARNAMQQRQCN